MIKLFARIWAAFWFWRGPKFRQIKRLQTESRLYGRKIRRIARSTGRFLVVRAPSTVTRTTSIGEGCVFNGVHVYGEGDVATESSPMRKARRLLALRRINFYFRDLLYLGTRAIKP